MKIFFNFRLNKSQWTRSFPILALRLPPAPPTAVTTTTTTITTTTAVTQCPAQPTTTLTKYLRLRCFPSVSEVLYHLLNLSLSNQSTRLDQARRTRIQTRKVQMSTADAVSAIISQSENLVKKPRCAPVRLRIVSRFLLGRMRDYRRRWNFCKKNCQS